MENYRLHVKIGSHEFNGEGPEESVRSDYKEWQALVANRGRESGGQETKSVEESRRSQAPESEQLGRVFRNEDRVSVRFLPQTEERDADVLLLILYGYRALKGQDDVAVTQLKLAMRQSGCPVQRVDRIAARYVSEGLVQKGGIAKGGVYRLSNAGEERALRLIGEMTR
jgi:hypothetical protein